jgi:hypothetical protein
MPATSKKQQAVMAIAEHNPKKLYKKNRGVLKMGKKKLHDFSSTPTRTLPERAEVKGYQEGGVIHPANLERPPITPPIPQKGFLNSNYGGGGRAATIFGPHSSRGSQKVMSLPDISRHIPKDWAKGPNMTPMVKTATRGLSAVLPGTAGALASDMVFPESAGLTPKEESEAIKAKGYRGFRKGGRV